jgi:hypothetical protein
MAVNTAKIFCGLMGTPSFKQERYAHLLELLTTSMRMVWHPADIAPGKPGRYTSLL